jgi:ectoine hydroxylase-related dioxygenase (phytanoyl-CoA dioxygenase family)
MKNKILLDPEQNKILIEKGYIVLDFCDPHELKIAFDQITKGTTELRLAGNNHRTIDVSFHCTYLDPDQDYKMAVWKALNDLIGPFLQANFADYKTIQANLFNKAPGTGVITPHQNLTTVDEEKYTSVSIWVPLQDTTELNGTLHFAPQSHGKFERYRNSNIHWAPMDASTEMSAYQMLPVSLKVGQALVFDDSIVHASPDNKSSENRYVFHYLAIPHEAKPIYCKRVNTEVQLIEVADLFWQTHTPGAPEPSDPILKTLPFNPRVYTKEVLLHELAKR